MSTHNRRCVHVRCKLTHTRFIFFSLKSKLIKKVIILIFDMHITQPIYFYCNYLQLLNVHWAQSVTKTQVTCDLYQHLGPQLLLFLYHCAAHVMLSVQTRGQC